MKEDSTGHETDFYMSVADFDVNLADTTEKLKLVYLYSDNGATQAYRFGEDILITSFRKLVIISVSFTAGFLILAAFRLRLLAKKITLQIVRLYETLEKITSNKSQHSAVLSFKKSSKELNELSRTFNKVAKTI